MMSPSLAKLQYSPKAVATGKMNDFNKDINSKISDLNGQRQAQVDGRSSVDAQIKKILNELTKER